MVRVTDHPNITSAVYHRGKARNQTTNQTKVVLKIEDITLVVISYEIYQTRLYIVYHMTFQNGFLSPLNWTLFARKMHCCHGRRHEVTCSRKKC